MKIFEGVVTSAKMPKTVTVRVDRQVKHPIYGKNMKRSTSFLCQDNLGVKEGETVRIQETRPLSAKKRFMVTEKVTK